MSELPQWIHALHHDGSEAFVSNPLPSIGDTVTIKLRVPQIAPIKHIYMRAMLDGEFNMIEMTPEASKQISTFWVGKLPIHQPRIDYRFKIMTDTGSYFYNARGISRADSPDFYDFTILADYQAPTWVRETVFYQIFPERFANGDPSNDVQDGEYVRQGHPTRKRQWGESPFPFEKSGSMDFFGGDLQGITQHLDYLDDLGINAIYLTPIFVAESNHKYDIVDFSNVDSHFGGNEALAELRAETAKRDMKLMLDITPNHVSYNHGWFRVLKDNPKSETGAFFYYNEKKKAYETWLGVSSLIKLNYSSKLLREKMYAGDDSILKQWLKPPYSIDAWRLDVANMTGNMGEMQLDHEVWEELRIAVKSFKEDVYLLGEYFQDGTPHIQGDELDASMNYQGFNMPMRRWLGGQDLGAHDDQPYADLNLMPSDALAEQWQTFIAAVPYPITLQQFNQLDSHDTTRILNVTGENKELVKLGTTLMMAFPGVPCIYYGGEIGITGHKDPDNRRTMVWDQTEWDQDLLGYFKQVIAIRKASHALKQGGFKVLLADGDVVAFARESTQQTMIAVGYRGTKILLGAEINVAQIGVEDRTVCVDQISGLELTVSGTLLKLPPMKQGRAMLFEVRR